MPETDGQSTAARRYGSARSLPRIASWEPPPLTGEFQSAFGSSVVEEFVVGHTPNDVLRELVQNEFDAGGTSLLAVFDEHGMTVAGTGKVIDRHGWDRLSLLLGTGRVVGAGQHAVEVPAKANGIGSKNFGLRSLFRFGDRIYVRSGGQMVVLDLRKLGTQRAADPTSHGRNGVSIYVPYRTDSFGRLEAFTVEHETAALNDVANGLLQTMIKLTVLAGRKSLRNVTVVCRRTARQLKWRQDAKRLRSRLEGVVALHRVARLTDSGPASRHATTYREVEFQRTVSIPETYRHIAFPSYFRASSQSLRVAVSVPVTRQNRVDLSRSGRFYYPLGISDGFTGAALSISAPFQMDAERTIITDCPWNRWLTTEAVELTLRLLTGDWLERFGANAYLSLLTRSAGNPPWFADAIKTRLKTDSCWPTGGHAEGSRVFTRANQLVLPAYPNLDGFLSEVRYLDERLGRVEEARTMARQYGALTFTLNSLVQLRCAPSNFKGLATSVPAGEAEYHFTDYEQALRDPDRQIRMAAALTKLSRHLSNQNRRDLRETESTLAADGSISAAKRLLRVDPTIWQVCPAPMSRRLHPDLLGHKAIANLCDAFAVGTWVREVATRARAGAASEEERNALYQHILRNRAALSASVLADVRKSPVVRDHRGNWASANALVSARASHFDLIEPVLSAPSRELESDKELLRRLRIRRELAGRDLTAYATYVAAREQIADAFEDTLKKLSRLLVPKIVDELRSIPFLRSQTGTLAAPERLHQTTSINLACLEPIDGFVAGTDTALYRRLKCPERPSSATLLSALARWREKGRGPTRSEIFYPALVAALRAERAPLTLRAQEPILWVNGRYSTPDDTLVGPRVPRCFRLALSWVRTPEILWRAYEELGAHQTANASHWWNLLQWFGKKYPALQTVLPPEERSALREAYRELGAQGLPEDLSESTRCLLSRDGTIHSVEELRRGMYVEDDYPELATAIRGAHGAIAFAELTAATSPFLSALGLKTLTSVSSGGQLHVGPNRPPPPWFRPEHGLRLIEMLHRPAFARALARLGWAYKRRGGSLVPLDHITLQSRLAAIERISFVRELRRIFRTADSTEVPIAIVVGVGTDDVALVSARSLRELEQLFARALAELLGATRIADSRSLAVLVLPLCQCRTTAEMADYLRWQGIEWEVIPAEDEGDESEEQDAEETGGFGVDVSEEVVRQLVGGIISEARGQRDAIEISSPQNQRISVHLPHVDATPTAFALPNLGDVILELVENTHSWIAPRPGGNAGVGGGGGVWYPPTAGDSERDGLVGARGEEIVYRRELERLRCLGYETPEDAVVWVSRVDPGADHDIRSIAEDGRPLWIEVKSTMGTDGRFDWPKGEFEKALREGDHYELWRVYQAHTERPVAKRFRDPVRLLQRQALRLDLATLRAVIEPMQVADALLESDANAQSEASATPSSPR